MSKIFVPLLLVWPVIFALRLNDLVVAFAALKSTIAPLVYTAGTSLQYCYKIPDIFE